MSSWFLVYLLWVVIKVENLMIDFDVCVVIFDVSYTKSFYVKYLMFGTPKILRMSFSVIETYDQI